MKKLKYFCLGLLVIVIGIFGTPFAVIGWLLSESYKEIAKLGGYNE